MPPAGSQRLESDSNSPERPYRRLKQFGLIVLCAAWVALGLVGHDPWKTDDATSIGVVWGIVQSGDWLAPTLAGEPFVARPPLVYATAAVFGKAISPWLPFHDAARIAVGGALALVLLLIGATARELYGPGMRWLPGLLLVGTVGLWDYAHQLSGEIGLLAGLALALYGFALALRRPIAGGLALGLGVVIAFLSRGFLGPLWIVLAAIVYPMVLPACRNRVYALAMGAALAIALPLCAAWPIALALREPAQLQAWWTAQHPSDYFALLGNIAAADPLYILKNLPWLAWPALPLVLWTLWTRGRGFRGGLTTPDVLIPGVFAAVILVCIVVMSDPRAIYTMPLMLPLCLLASLEVDSLPRGGSSALDWFGILTFGLFAALVWWAWADSLIGGIPPTVARVFRDTEPGFRPPLQWPALGVSVFLTLLWFALVRPARRTNSRAVLNWAAGMMLVWGMYMTIWLPYLDSRRSYRPVAEALARQLPPGACVASHHVGEPQRALLYYFGNIKSIREEAKPAHSCDFLLVQFGRHDNEATSRDGWQVIWQGARRGDDTERFVLYQKVPT